MGEDRSASWYPDPGYPDQLRYWDGLKWTDHRSPARRGQGLDPERRLGGADVIICPARDQCAVQGSLTQNAMKILCGCCQPGEGSRERNAGAPWETPERLARY